MRRVVLWAAQRTEVLALIKTTTDLNVRDFRWTVTHSRKTGGMEVARLEYDRYGRHHFFQFDRHQGQHYAIYTAGNDGNVKEDLPGTRERVRLDIGDRSVRGAAAPSAPGPHDVGFRGVLGRPAPRTGRRAVYSASHVHTS